MSRRAILDPRRLEPVRRAAYVWQFVAAAALPVWILVGWSLWGSGGATLVGLVLVAPAVLVTQLLLAGLFAMRGSVRRTRTLGWRETAAATVFQALVVGAGFFGPATSWLALLAVVAAIVAFWVGVGELTRDFRARVRETAAAFGVGPRGGRRPDAGAKRPPIDAGEYIVLPKTPKPGTQH